MNNQQGMLGSRAAWKQVQRMARCAAVAGIFVGFFAAQLALGQVAPTIATQPQNQTALVGNNATFSVSVFGSAPFNFQWWFNLTNSLPGATNALLTVTNVQLANGGNYFVVVANSSGSITSDVATLRVG